MKQEREKRGGRPRLAKPVPNQDGTYSVRTTLEVEGETVRRMVHLGTSDFGVAKARAKRLAAGEAEELVAAGGTTFREVAEELMKESSLATKKDRERRLRQFAYPVMGSKTVDAINVRDVKACLRRAEEAMGGWTMTVRHLKNDISAILGSLYNDQLIDENVALRISYRRKDGALDGKRVKRTVLPRVVLSDDEFEQLIEYGLSQHEGSLPELYMLIISARCLGGMRTSDLHAWRWDHIDTVTWKTAQVPRPKTQGKIGEDGYGETVLVPYDLPDELVPYLQSWWHRQGCPTEGPVFPVRRGPRAGLHKGAHISYAKALRAELWAAGVVRPLPGFEQARPEDRRKHCALQSGVPGKFSAVDFHSFRRAWVTATSNVKGLSFAESMALADHSDPATHLRYRRDEKHRVVPAGVLPRLPQLASTQPGKGGFGSGSGKTDLAHSEFLNDSRRARVNSNHRPTAPEAAKSNAPSVLSEVFAGATGHRPPRNATHWQN
jgi:integrase